MNLEPGGGKPRPKLDREPPVPLYETTTYLNTDLELGSTADLTSLVRQLETAGLCVLHSERRENGLWSAWLEPETTQKVLCRRALRPL